MSFDALTIFGILSAALSGGFFIALVKWNDSGRPARRGVAEIDSRG